MSYDVRKEYGANKSTVAGFTSEALAKADALVRCTSAEAEYVVYDTKSMEVGRAIFDGGKAYWRSAA